MAHIEKRRLSDGSTAYRVVWTDPSGKRRRRQFSRAQTSSPAKAAGKFKTEVESELLRGTYVDPADGHMTVAEYFEVWRAGHHKRPKTLANIDANMRLHVLPLIGGLRIGGVRRRDVQGMVDVLTVKPVGGLRSGPRPALSPGFVREVYVVAASVFRGAVLDKVIPASPCVRIHLPERRRSEVVIPTPDQVARAADAVPSWNRGLILLAAGSGLRSGELRGLDLDRLRVLERTVRVDRQLTGVQRRAPVFGPPKTQASYRTVPIAAEWAEDAAEHLRRFGTGDDGLVFCARSRQPLRKGTLSAALGPVLRELGMPVQSGMHVFRHFYVSSLIAGGEDILTVMRRAGHATSEETLTTYSHLWPEHEERTRTASAAAHPTRGRSGGSQGVRGARRGSTEASSVHPLHRDSTPRTGSDQS